MGPLDVESSFRETTALRPLPAALGARRSSPARSMTAWMRYRLAGQFAIDVGYAGASAPIRSGSPGFQSRTSTEANGSGLNQFGPSRGSPRARVVQSTQTRPVYGV